MTAIVISAALLATLAGPLALGVAGALRAWRHWRLSTLSAVLHAIAFNLIFFIQEVFLVVPKALTPGLQPTLYHNNHAWQGDHPLAHLFQGTGALAILLVGLGFAFWLARWPPASAALRLFVIWIAFQGFYQSIPQVVVGAVFPGNDVGMALNYLGLGAGAKAFAAFAALAALIGAGLWLTPRMLSVAPDAQEVDTPTKRARFILGVATLPALMALPIIILSRVPGSIDQVVIVPVAVMIIGLGWLQASAWREQRVTTGVTQSYRLASPIAALAAIIAFFHVVLRPGVAFF